MGGQRGRSGDLDIDKITTVALWWESIILPQSEKTRDQRSRKPPFSRFIARIHHNFQSVSPITDPVIWTRRFGTKKKQEKKKSKKEKRKKNKFLSAHILTDFIWGGKKIDLESLVSKHYSFSAPMTSHFHGLFLVNIPML